MTTQSQTARFAELHRAGTFVMPNAWDAGSARILETLGFPAIGTTSAGFASSLGRMDQRTTLAELEEHVAALTAAVAVPVSVDAEHGYAADPDGVADAVRRLAARGAAGVSIEDHDPARGVFPRDEAVARVAAAAAAARESGVVLTARADNHFYGVDDVDDTIARLTAFAAAGADVLYAPWLTPPDDIARVVAATPAPVNVLLRPDGPTIADLARLGVRRISTGGALALAAYGALARVAAELQGGDATAVWTWVLDADLRRRAFDH